MHLIYLCNVIRLLRSYKQLISTLWIGVMFLSISLIVLHRHDLHTDSNDSCHLTEKHNHQHSHAEDCQYCFLFFQQGINLVTPFLWESNPESFQINTILNNRIFESPLLKIQSSKSLRAHPFYTLSKIV